MMSEAKYMKRAVPLLSALGFFLLFVNPSFTFGQFRNPQSSATSDANLSYKDKDADTKATVKDKPQPSYTKEAKKHKIEGTVILRCVFTSTGQVTNIRVVSGLPYGLTERAIEAAKEIKFIPATKDGHPVSMWMQLEYNFNLY